MNSPLPSSSLLEAGLISDPNGLSFPNRLSRIQENVRNLLKTSHRTSLPGTPSLRHVRPDVEGNFDNSEDRRNGEWVDTVPNSPTLQLRLEPGPGSEAEAYPRTQASPQPHPSGHLQELQATPLPSPKSSPSQMSTHYYPHQYPHLVDRSHPSERPNIRTVTPRALDHPDLADPSLAAVLLRTAEGRQKKAWKRSHRGAERGAKGVKFKDAGDGKRKTGARYGSKGGVLGSVLAAVLLAVLVATYVVLATRPEAHPTAAFHILFVLGIVLAMGVFVHSLSGILGEDTSISHKSRAWTASAATKPNQRTSDRRHHRRHHHRIRSNPQAAAEIPLEEAISPVFMPSSPIAIHTIPTAEEEVRPDTREARPTSAITRLSQQAATLLHASVGSAENADDAEEVAIPPPAYGRWRGSVRADPGLLYWRPVSLVSPRPMGAAGGAAAAFGDVEVAREEVLSPRYEEIAVEGGAVGPPSYITRKSPARSGREMVEIVDEDTGESLGSANLGSARAGEVRWSGEMLEARVFS